MKRRILGLAAGLLSVTASVFAARINETPIPFLNINGPYYYNYYSYFRDMDRGDWCVDVNASLGVYYRSIDESYRCGRCRVPFSTLLFGKSEFTLAEAFPNGTPPAAVTAANPWIAISTITPRYSYDERGAVLGLDLGSQYSYCDVPYHFGLRARLPVRDVSINEICGANNITGETLNDVYQTRIEVIEDLPATTPPTYETNEVFAIRLDFLNQLNVAMDSTGSLLAPGNEQPMIVASAGSIAIAGQPNAGGTPTNFDVPAVQVLYSADGVPVDRRWGTPVNLNANAFPQNPGVLLPDNGNFTVVSNDAAGRAYFGQAGSDYTGLLANQAVSSNLWVVPSLEGAYSTTTGTTPNPNYDRLTQAAQSIKTAIANAVNNIDSSVQDFLNQQGISFCEGRRKGLGDLDLELYLGRNWYCDQIYTDLIFGVIFPTSKDSCSSCQPTNCLKLIDMPLGTNGHYQVRIAAAAGYDYCDWVKLSGYFTYNWVLRHTESIAAPFVGATIRNIGPCISARTDWEEVLGNVDLTFYATDCCGLAVGYQGYHKRCECARFCQATAIPFGGTDADAAALDANVWARYTNATAHKLRVGFFSDLGNDCNLFAGFSQVIAGNNIGRETDWYASINVAF